MTHTLPLALVLLTSTTCIAQVTDAPAQAGAAPRMSTGLKVAHGANLGITSLLGGYWIVQLMGDDAARLEYSGATFAETQSLANKRLGVAFPVMMGDIDLPMLMLSLGGDPVMVGAVARLL